MANIREGLSKALNIATAPARAAVNVTSDVVGGARDYVKKNNEVHKTALNKVGAEQKTRIANVGQHGSPTPYGTDAFYGKASEEAKKMKKAQGISLTKSIGARLKNPNDNPLK